VCPREVTLEFKMIDRRMIGDLALAVLIALPTVVMARPGPAVHQDRIAAVPLMPTPAIAERTPINARAGLLG
jgi:hypothetical protein